jgi:hypothetical protein
LEVGGAQSLRPFLFQCMNGSRAEELRMLRMHHFRMVSWFLRP